MKVILQKDILNLGDAGDVKDVADGYARNYLIPNKLVLPARGNSIRAVEHQKKMRNLRVEKRTKEMEGLAEKIKALSEIEIAVRVGAKSKLFGSVTPAAIAQALRDQGFMVDKRKIEPSDPLRALGSYPLKVRLAEKITVPITVNVVADQASLAALEEMENERASAEASAASAAEANAAPSERAEAAAEEESVSETAESETAE